MMTKKTESEKPQKKSLLVTVTLNSKQPYEFFIISAAQEYFGIHLQNRNVNPNILEMEVLFEKLVDGETFYKMLENTKLKIEKVEC